jgi:hypothetical protein
VVVWSNGLPMVPQSQVCNRSLDMTCAADSTWFVLVRSVAHHVHPFVMCKLRVVVCLLMINILNVCDFGCAPQSQVCNRSLDMTCAADLTWFVRVRSVAQSIRLSCASCVWSSRRLLARAVCEFGASGVHLLLPETSVRRCPCLSMPSMCLTFQRARRQRSTS